MKLEVKGGSHYGRTLSAEVVTNALHYACDMCGAKDVPLLITDGSDNEYREVCLCRPCVNNLFDNPETTK